MLMERILLAMTVLGMACLCIGVPLYLAGRAFDVFTMAQVGVFLLLTGVVLIVMRILYWILEELVGHGLESMGKQDALQMILSEFQEQSSVFSVFKNSYSLV